MLIYKREWQAQFKNIIQLYAIYKAITSNKTMWRGENKIVGQYTMAS